MARPDPFTALLADRETLLSHWIQDQGEEGYPYPVAEYVTDGVALVARVSNVKVDGRLSLHPPGQDGPDAAKVFARPLTEPLGVLRLQSYAFKFLRFLSTVCRAIGRDAVVFEAQDDGRTVARIVGYTLVTVACPELVDLTGEPIALPVARLAAFVEGRCDIEVSHFGGGLPAQVKPLTLDDAWRGLLMPCREVEGASGDKE